MLRVAIEVERRRFQVAADFEVAAGERMSLFGPSGSGKTTILETITGLVRPRTGEIRLGDRILLRTAAPAMDLPVWRRRVGLLRQNPALFPHLSVDQNLTYGQGRRRAQDPEELIRRLELGDLGRARPAQLSGGQAHRVAAARLLLADHDALFLDEPYTGLDRRLARLLTDLIRDTAERRHLPTVMVTHELPEAQAFADTMAVLDEGRVLQRGHASEIVRRPASRRVAELVGYVDFLGLPEGGTLGLHPDRIRPGASPGLGRVLRGTVRRRRPSGAVWEADLEVASSPTATLTCRFDDVPPDPGADCEVTLLDPPRFDRDGKLTAETAR
ncbi:MAG TPA: ABC transporter ATP-binding protein [Candidatus Dormibacteraeota bacterium]|nr:ABC transporter ATP-binding protein [Candidatus Dormibacteraeota bacterium]